MEIAVRVLAVAFLVVGDDGLGFTVVTRARHDGGQCMVYIKNILQQGSAAKDGRLKPGDLILEVHDYTELRMCMTHLSLFRENLETSITYVYSPWR